MSLSLAELQPVLHDLFFDTADSLARHTGFTQRARKLSGSVFARTLVFSLLQKPDSTLDDFADFALIHLDVDATPQAFDQRFTAAAAAFFRELFFEAFNRSFNTARAALLPVLRRFNGVFVRDATLVRLPACLAGLFPGRKGRGKAAAGAAVKLVVQMEVTTGQLTEASELAGRDNEKTAEAANGPLPEGALLLEDMGFFSGDRLLMYIEQGVYVLTRIPAWTAVFDEDGERIDLVKWLRRAKGWRLRRRVRILHGKKVTLRLLAVRVPDAVAQERRERVLREAKERGRRVSQKKLELCEWNILLTNAPEQLLDADEACAVRRVRWQVELLFKVFKSEGGIEKTRSQCRWRVLSELYAKLLAMVVQQWLLLCAGYVMLKHSARRASRRVRRLAGALVRALESVRELGRELAGLAVLLHRRCGVERRHRHPSTLDRLADLDLEWRQLEQAA
jgi:hypothetical protein